MREAKLIVHEKYKKWQESERRAELIRIVVKTVTREFYLEVRKGE